MKWWDIHKLPITTLSILHIIDKEDWKDMGLFELEKVRSKGDMVERFAVSVGPMGWKPQGVRIVTIQISKNETYL